VAAHSREVCRASSSVLRPADHPAAGANAAVPAHEFDVPQARERTATLYETLSLLSRCATLYASLNQARVAQATGMTSAEIQALYIVAEFEGLTIGQLMQLMGLSAGGTTALVDRLERAGLIARARHPNDRRSVVLRPLPHQWPLALRRTMAQRLDVNVVGAGLSPEQRQAMCVFLERSLQALRTEAGRMLSDHGPA